MRSDPSLTSLAVVLGILTNAQDEILITQRAFDTSYGGHWEIPGGKIESGESPEIALKRELREELNIEVKHATFFGEQEHCSPTHRIQLLAFHVLDFTGTPTCLAGQIGYQWVKREALKSYAFPPATQQLFVRYWNINI